MSYEGYTQYILKDGSYICKDAYDDMDDRHNSQIEWWHSVDQTNGWEKDDPSTQSLEVEVYEHKEEEKVDYKGNIYYVLVPTKYRPVNPEWWRHNP